MALASDATDRARSNGLATASVIATVATSEIPFGAMAPLLNGAVMTQADRFRALTRGCSALTEAAGGKQLVLCADDAHLLDPLSAALVHQAVTSGSAMLLATIRRDHEVPGDLTALWKDELVARLEITALARSESEQLVEMVLGSPVHGATMERLRNLTEGNVLFLRIAIDTALTSGELTERDGIRRLDGHFEPGQALVDLVRLRLGSLTARQERVLEYVALAEPGEADIITAIMPPADLQDAERTGALTVAVAREIRAGSVGDDAVDPRYAEPPRPPTVGVVHVEGDDVETVLVTLDVAADDEVVVSEHHPAVERGHLGFARRG